MLKDKDINLNYEYSHEINEINYIMHNLENSLIYKITGSKMDGYLATNISKLRTLLNDMLVGIQKNELNIKKPNREIFKAYK